jgi:hypothetical protein
MFVSMNVDGYIFFCFMGGYTAIMEGTPMIYRESEHLIAC